MSSTATALALLLAAIGMLSAAGMSLRGARDQVARDAWSLQTLQMIETELLRYARVSTLVSLGQEGSASVAGIEQRVGELLDRADRLAVTDAEREGTSQLREHANRYIESRKALAARELPLPETLRQARESFDAAIASVAELEALEGASLERSRAASDSVWRVSTAVSLLAAVLAIAGVLIMNIELRKYVLEPLRAIGASIVQARGGDPDARAPLEGPREIRDIAQAFNESAAELARQRSSQAAFIAGVAHDLRTPLGALKMGLHQVASDGGDDAMVACMERQIDHLLAMLNDLQDRSRIESGELDLHMSEHDIRESARQVVGLYRPTSAAHEIVLSLPPAPVMVWADPLRIEEVLSNLLSNAIKYSPDRGRVVVAVEKRDSEAVVEVTDQGVGMSPDVLPTLFEPFRRGRDSIGLAGGSGLGLSVVRRIVSAHGGHIEVESSPGVGSTFRVSCPLAGSRDAAAPTACKSVPSSPARHHGS